MTGMPQDSMFTSSAAPDVGLRLTIVDHVAELDDALTIGVELRRLDGPWESFGGLRLDGRGRDFLATSVEDLTHAWHYEDRAAILREAQRNQRAARIHNRRSMRTGN